MRTVLIIVILFCSIFTQAQKVKKKYYKESYVGMATLKIKWGHQYKDQFRYDKDSWNGNQHLKGIKCLTGFKKQNRKKIIKGTWKTNGDTLFLIRRITGIKPKIQKYLITKGRLKSILTDSIIYRCKQH